MSVTRRTALLASLGFTLMGDAHIQVHGHRGARAVRPENTLPAFQYAIDVGVDVLELDLAVTKDNVLVVSHDPTLLPDICTGPNPGTAIHQLTLAELQEYDCGAKRNPRFRRQTPVPGTRVPTFRQVLELAKPARVELNVETKIFAARPELTPSPEEFAKLVLDEVNRAGMTRRIILQSFDFRTLHAMKKLAPQMRLSALYEGKPKSFVEIAHEAGAEIISPEYHLVTAEEVRAAHAAHLQVVPWTVNEPADWDRLVGAGVDGIISDDPAALLKHLGR